MAGIAPQEEVEKWGDQFNAHACGTGPFKLVSYKPGEEVVLERFDEYWGPKPYLDRIIYKFYRSDETRLMALQKGELDLAVLFDDARPTMDKDPNITYQPNMTRDVFRKAYFNMRRWPMNDIRFRMAVGRVWIGKMCLSMPLLLSRELMQEHYWTIPNTSTRPRWNLFRLTTQTRQRD